MKQLKMYWKAEPSTYPENTPEWHYRTYDGSQRDRDAWVEICTHGLLGPGAEQPFEKYMSSMEIFDENSLFFVEHDGEIVATIAALTDQNKVGLFHMVGAARECRGHGVGNLLAKIAKARLWECGATHAYLTTDEFRVPAVKSYLTAGFCPVNWDTDMEARWLGMLYFLEVTDVPFVEEDGTFIKLLNPSAPQPEAAAE